MAVQTGLCMTWSETKLVFSCEGSFGFLFLYMRFSVRKLTVCIRFTPHGALTKQKHYENLPMQYTEIFKVVKIEKFQWKFFDIFLIFAQNIDCGYTLEPPRRGGYNEYPQSMFGAKIRKTGIPLLLYKSGVQGGIYCTDMFS